MCYVKINKVAIIKQMGLIVSLLDDSIELVQVNKDLLPLKDQIIHTQEDIKKIREELIQVYNVSI